MPAPNSKSVGLWFFGVVALGCAGAIGGVAWYRGAIHPLAWLSGGPALDEAPPAEAAPRERIEPDLDPELFAAQTEPEPEAEDEGEPAGEPSLAGSRRPPAVVDTLDDSGEDDARLSVETANYEETLEEEAVEAPPATETTKPRREGRTRDSLPAAKAKPNGEQSRHSAVDADPGESRNTPLMDLDRIETLEADGDLIAAQHELSRRYWQKPAEREELLPGLNRMARALYFSPQPHYYEPYVVQQGDQLRVIGQKHKLSWEYLSRLNHVDSRKIRAGQKLKVVPGPFAARVSLSRYELVVHLAGSYVKSYRVGVGKDGTTPLGAFTVKNKMVDPTYYGPEGVIAHDDPQNPLGERWIDIGDSYGIHGTIEPASIGKNESRGCIRMLNSDVEEVYDFLVNGSEVRIHR